MGVGKWCAVLVVTLGGAGAVRGQQVAPAVAGATSSGAQRATTQAQADLARWRSVVMKLGSEDFAVREAAQKELDKEGVNGATLKALAEAATDAEVKARLLERIEALEEQTMLHPPGITIAVKDARLAEVSLALSSAAGVDLAPAQGEMAGERFSVEMTDRPFWEVFSALSGQHPLGASGNGEQLALRRSAPTMVGAQVVGSFLVYADYGPPAPKGRLALRLLAAADPRMKVKQYQLTELSVVDDAGNELAADAPHQQPTHPVMTGDTRMLLLDRAFAPGGGTRVVGVSGKVMVEVLVREEREVVADVSKAVLTPVTLAGQTVEFTQYEARLGAILVHGITRGGAREPDITVKLRGGNGEAVMTARGPFSAALGQGFAPPISAELTVVLKTKEVEVPFALKADAGK